MDLTLTVGACSRPSAPAPPPPPPPPNFQMTQAIFFPLLETGRKDTECCSAENTTKAQGPCSSLLCQSFFQGSRKSAECHQQRHRRHMATMFIKTSVQCKAFRKPKSEKSQTVLCTITNSWGDRHIRPLPTASIYLVPLTLCCGVWLQVIFMFEYCLLHIWCPFQAYISLNTQEMQPSHDFWLDER